ncbi:MAG: polysaccharide pyruvyl transferase family protein [Cyanobacteriota bacterium]|nr:polysaccharide pyruvyl transferase family protein [Cyanobacteriota bacterium]
MKKKLNPGYIIKRATQKFNESLEENLLPLPIVTNTAAALLRLKRNVLLRQSLDSSVLILPPAPPGSLGDEALVSGAIDFFKRAGIQRIGVISYKPSLRWKNLDILSNDIELHHHFLGGYLHAPNALLSFLDAVSQYQHFYCIGADVMDGYYNEEDSLQRLKFISLAIDMGAKADVLGFSFNDQPKPKIIEALRNLSPSVQLCARDPVSYRRLVERLDRPVKLVADLAFLLDATKESEIVRNVSNWIGQQQAEGRVVLGINANYKLIEKLEIPEIERLVQIYISTLTELYSQALPLSFVLIPHDFRNIKGKNSDVVLANAIWEELSPEIQSHCLQVPTPCSAAEIKGIAGNLDLVLSGRMHLAIASLGQGTPAACITYQGKFEGLFEHFELEGMAIEPEQALQPGNLVPFLMPLIEKRDALRSHVREKLPQVQKLARANFE